jgi:hypothetical protein
MLRRDMLSIGGLTLAGLGLPNIRIDGQEKQGSDPSVIMIFLAGGMSHAESFTAMPDSVGNYRSVTGYLKTKDGYYLGGYWNELAKNSNLFSVVHSFNHINAGHQGGTVYVNTGYNFNNENPGAASEHPSFGSIVSKTYGTNNTKIGTPHYIATNRVVGQSAGFLGGVHNPFTLDEEGKKSLILNVDSDRFVNRLKVLEGLDRKFNKDKNVNLVTEHKKQGANILLGTSSKAFDLSSEKAALEQYGNTNLGKQLILARRLIEFGSRFVTAVDGDWDHHTDIKAAMERRVPPTDKAIAALLLDLKERSMLDNTLVVVATEFGRTPINANAGRDHYARTTPLLLAGGNYTGKGVIGEVDKNGFEVKSSSTYSPIDLLKTVLTHVGVSGTTQYTDPSGRPRYLVEGEAKIIT